MGEKLKIIHFFSKLYMEEMQGNITILYLLSLYQDIRKKVIL
jgi:hypothetical protein